MILQKIFSLTIFIILLFRIFELPARFFENFGYFGFSVSNPGSPAGGLLGLSLAGLFSIWLADYTDDLVKNVILKLFGWMLLITILIMAFV